jgi:hypothetical protein
MLYAALTSPMRATCPAHLILLAYNYTFTLYLFKIYLNIILASMPRSHKRCLSFKYLGHSFVWFFNLIHPRYMPVHLIILALTFWQLHRSNSIELEDFHGCWIEKDVDGIGCGLLPPSSGRLFVVVQQHLPKGTEEDFDEGQAILIVRLWDEGEL